MIALKGMNIEEYVENDKKDYLVLNYKVVDDFTDGEYLEMFQKLKDESIIRNISYNDIEWVLQRADGHKNHIKFDMGIRPLVNEKLRHYILLKLHKQKVSVHTASIHLKAIKTELLETHFLDKDYIHTYREQVGSYNDTRKKYLFAFMDFLKFCQLENAKEYFAVVDGTPMRYPQRSRELPCYQSIILFDYIINDFIKRKNIMEKARYYPVLIWWKVSSVIPLRPGEVYQLPKDCVFEKNGKYYIHIERIKNRFKRRQYSKPVIKDFEINDDVYFTIRDYVDYISEFDDTEYLFSVKSLKKVAGIRSKDIDVKRLTQSSMGTIYKRFKKEVIEQEYGYHIVPLGQRKDRNDIEEIKMGDVRHLAIINLMMMGYNPLYIMELAGHQRLNTQMGYYNHVDTFATAKSHVLKEMIKKNNGSLYLNEYNSGDYVLQKTLLGDSYYNLPLVFDGKGRCRSKNFPYDCVCTECIFCPHFIPDRNLSKDYYDELKKENEKDMEALQMELKLLLQEHIDNRKFEKVGKEIGVTLNRRILINAYQYLREEE